MTSETQTITKVSLSEDDKYVKEEENENGVEVADEKDEATEEENDDQEEEDDDNCEVDNDDCEEDDNDCCHQMVHDVPCEPPDNDCRPCGRLMSPKEAILSCKICGYDVCSECIIIKNK